MISARNLSMSTDYYEHGKVSNWPGRLRIIEKEEEYPGYVRYVYMPEYPRMNHSRESSLTYTYFTDLLRDGYWRLVIDPELELDEGL